MSLLTRSERGVDGAGELAFEAADRFASALALVRAAASFAKSVTTGHNVLLGFDYRNGVDSPHVQSHGKNPQVVGDGEEDLVGSHAPKGRRMY